jgi:UDP-N-acetylmuramoylalanine--D-glutamate ligase
LSQEPERGAQVEDDRINIGGTDICGVDELGLLGPHNWENVCAAIAATWEIIGHDKEAIRSVITTFKGLPHRLELVREVRGVNYYNDSFAATPDAAIACMAAIREHKVIILGGFDRQLPIEHLATALKEQGFSLRKAIFIGASAERLAKKSEEAGFTNFVISPATTMPEILEQASMYALEGDAVVLSPGFASFDMFKNFEDRGNQFRDTVNSL